MSQAFVKEPDGNEVFTDLPDRPVSEHPNYVTESGLALMEAALADARERNNVAQTAGNRSALAESSRDLRYWTIRRATAELVPAPEDNSEVRFGSKVSISRDGKVQKFRIVGEDEADPAKGLLSYVSPLARALMRKGEGDEAALGGESIEILKIE